MNFPDLKPISLFRLQQMANNAYYSFERKWDGTAVSVTKTKNEIILTGRGILKDGSQSDYTDKFPELVSAIEDSLHPNHPGSFLGEIVVAMDGVSNEVKESFQSLQSRTTRIEDIEEYARKYPATLLLFDREGPSNYLIRKNIL